MAPRLHSLGHVALRTPDLEASLTFFRDAVGLEEVERVDGTAYLRTPEEFEHHTLSVTEGDSAGVDHIGWQTADPESVAAFADKLESEGVDVTWVEAGTEPGQGEAIRFSTPTGHRFECYYEMEKVNAPADRRSKLKNKPYADTTTNPIAPRYIDHVQIWDDDAHALADWMCEHLDFRVQELYDKTDGSRWGTWISANGVKIEAAVIQNTADDPPASLNHVAYKVDNDADLFDAAGAMRERNIPTDGFGQHSVSRGKFLYARDPVSDHTIEFSAGGYHVFDPEWEPIEWREDDLKDRQWVGRIAGGVNVPY